MFKNYILRYKNNKKNKEKTKRYKLLEQHILPNHSPLNNDDIFISRQQPIEIWLTELFKHLPNASAAFLAFCDGMKWLHYDFNNIMSQVNWTISGRSLDERPVSLLNWENTPIQTILSGLNQDNNTDKAIEAIIYRSLPNYQFNELSKVDNVKMLYESNTNQDGDKFNPLLPNIGLLVNKYNQLFFEQLQVFDEQWGQIEYKFIYEKQGFTLKKSRIIPFCLLGIIPYDEFFNRFKIQQYHNQNNTSIIEKTEFKQSIPQYELNQVECLLKWDKHMIEKLIQQTIETCIPIYEPEDEYLSFQQLKTLLVFDKDALTKIDNELNQIMQKTLDKLEISSILI